jgi:hypothetical protein
MTESTSYSWLRLRLVGIVAAGLAAIWTGRMALFCAWATATPLSRATAATYADYANAWGTAFIVSIVATITLLTSVIRRWYRSGAQR